MAGSKLYKQCFFLNSLVKGNRKYNHAFLAAFLLSDCLSYLHSTNKVIHNDIKGNSYLHFMHYVQLHLTLVWRNKLLES